jgi:hypothetical protein
MVSDVGGKSAAGQADNYSEGREERPIQSDPRRGRNQEPPNRKWSLGILGIVDLPGRLGTWDLGPGLGLGLELGLGLGVRKEK